MGTTSKFAVKNGITSAGTNSFTYIATETSNTISGTGLNSSVNPASTSSAWYEGSRSTASSLSTCSQNITGGINGSESVGAHYGSGTCAYIVGSSASATLYSTGGAVTYLMGFQVSSWGNSASSSTLTNAYGVWVATPTTTGPITNLYGIFVNPISGGTANYAIYTNAGKTHFGDQTEVIYTTTTTIGGPAGFYSSVTANPASSSAAYYYGLNSRCISSSSCAQNISAIVGSYSYAQHQGTGNVTYLIGCSADTLSNNASGTISNLWGFYVGAWGNNASGGTVTTAIGLRMEALTTIGTVTHAYGIYLGNVGGATTINYAIYTNAGKVYIGDTTTSTAYNNGALIVAGGVGVAGNSYFGNFVNITYTSTQSSATEYAHLVALTINPAGTSSQSYYGVRGQLDVSSSCAQNITSTNLMANAAVSTHSGTGTVTNLTGMKISSYKNNTGPVTSLTGLNIENWGNNNATGAVTTAYGTYINSPLIVGTVTNAYGIYLGNVSGAATNNYAIFTGTGLVRFGDAVTINSGTGDGSAYDTKFLLQRTSSTGNVLCGKVVLDDKNTDFGNMVFRIKSTSSSAENDAYYTDAVTIDGQNGNVTLASTTAATAASSAALIMLGGIGQNITSTLASGNIAGYILALTSNPSGVSSANIYGINLSVGTNTNNAQNHNLLTVFQANAIHSGTATLTDIFGGYFHYQANNTGNTTNASGLKLRVESTAANTIANGSGLRVEAPSISGGGAITTNYGVYIGDQKPSGVTTGYGLYLANQNGYALYTGTGTNRLGDKILVKDLATIDTTTLTTTSISQVALASVAGATYRSVKFQIQGVDSTGSKYHTTEIIAIHNGTTAQTTEYASINLGGVTATFTVDYNSGNLRLLVTPASTNSTVFKVSMTLIAV